ncbi:hypothetical protein PFISCL1PPCAC_9965 [Pristionchus fissidentatus]|uniref:Gem-associated protein 8 n=1 Tax=Pristionchus fissidentatus TaxID=1538716 RepID=A0AAV5VK76_9BILA|nr:hypothetical protein PFISCL1PPCAC_9965 [Pristionchus fissidentatus]
MLVYWKQEWAREARFDSFWKHFEASERWRKGHQEARAELNKSPRMEVNITGKRAKLERRLEVKKEEEMGEGPSRDEEEEEDKEEEERGEEMNEEMKEFFRQTLKHRAEREAMRNASKKEDEKKKSSHWIRIDNEEYMPADKIGVEGIQSRSFAAPNEPAAVEEKRTQARLLYGDNWDKVLSMESEMDMKFRRICDETQPPLWPVIPFRL